METISNLSDTRTHPYTIYENNSVGIKIFMEKIDKFYHKKNMNRKKQIKIAVFSEAGDAEVVASDIGTIIESNHKNFNIVENAGRTSGDTLIRQLIFPGNIFITDINSSAIEPLLRENFCIIYVKNNNRAAYPATLAKCKYCVNASSYNDNMTRLTQIIGKIVSELLRK